MSCWLDIDETHQRGLVQSLEAALASPSIPPEIVTALLNLAEFMEHDERPLPLDTRTLGALAEKCHAFAKVCNRLPWRADPKLWCCVSRGFEQTAGGLCRRCTTKSSSTRAAR